MNAHVQSRPTSRAVTTSQPDVYVAAQLSPSERKRIERLAKGGELARVYKGLYVKAEGGEAEVERRVSANWAAVGGVVVPGGVVSHLSALHGGPKSGTLVISHPTLTRRSVKLPGLTLEIRTGSGNLAGDMALSQSGLHFAGRTRALLENLGRKSSIKAGQEEVEHRLTFEAPSFLALTTRLRVAARGKTQRLSSPSFRTMLKARSSRLRMRATLS